MSPIPRTFDEYHIFLTSPSDVNAERKAVRDIVNDYNQNIGEFHKIRFTVVDWENQATIGAGRPQELITQQTLEKNRNVFLSQQ